MRKSITKFFPLSSRDRWLFAVAYVLLGLIRFSLLYLPFKLVARRLGVKQTNTQPIRAPGIDNPELYCDLIRVTELASRHTPWQSRCLVQSICLALLLNMYRLPYTLCIGMTHLASPDKKTLAAHAWVIAGKHIASWNSDHTEYAPVCRFVSRRAAMDAAPQFPTCQ